MLDELTWTSARELRRLIAERQVSPVDVVAACLARIDALDPALHAFITVAGERALDDAKTAEAGVQRGDALGPLHGVPVALKDEAWTADIPSTGGSLLFQRFVPTHDGTVAERLRRAGAIVIGKTNMPEFAAWPRSKTRLAGESVNPWDTTRISGASSGGSAAAVAAGMVPLAIGSDGGGSTRIPSAFCGVVGLFPTPGRVPSYGSFSYSTEGSLGPIGRSVADVAVLQRVIAGPDPRDALASTANRAGRRQRIGRRCERRCVSPGLPTSDGSPSTPALPPPVGTRWRGRPRPEPSSTRSPAASSIPGATALSSPTSRPPLPPEAGNSTTPTSTYPTPTPSSSGCGRPSAARCRSAPPPEFRALCQRYRHLLTPPSQLTYQAPASAPTSPTPSPAPVPTTDELKSALRAVFETHDVICSPTMATVAPVAPPGWATPYADSYMGTNFTFIANSTGCPRLRSRAGSSTACR